jgi:hypothetical protein
MGHVRYREEEWIRKVVLPSVPNFKSRSLTQDMGSRGAGTLPDAWAHMSRLQRLDLSRNAISGEPMSVGKSAASLLRGLR